MKRPYIFLLTGTSLDGKISNFKRVQSEIATNDDKEIRYVYRIRADAVMIGGRSIILDDPKLTVKTKERQEQRRVLGKTREPTKVGIISNIEKINLNGEFINSGNTKVIIFTTNKTSKQVIEDLEKNSLMNIYVLGEEKVDLRQAMGILYEKGIRTLMVEGGGELNYSLLKENLIDEINLFIGDVIIGGRNSPTLVDGKGFNEDGYKKFDLIECIKKGNHVILKYKIRNEQGK